MEIKDTLFVPSLQPAVKHSTILTRFDNLDAGDTLLIINDHDPIPLYYEMKAEKGDVFEWKKVENGPDVWKVEIKKTSGNTCSVPKPVKTEVADSCDMVLNVTLLEPKMKHPSIFRMFDALEEGNSFQILNDHDPKPLYYQMIAERGNIFTWTYLEKGPQWWKVKIQKNDAGSEDTVGEIAAKDIRKADVFKKYGIDFCCGGKKSLTQACEEKGIDPLLIKKELEDSSQQASSSNDFNKWAPDFLADYIYNQHHLYYYNEAPVIKDMAAKVAAHHGSNIPELIKLNELYNTLQNELDSHFAREEKVLFPFIKALALAKKSGNLDVLKELSLTEPIQMMESDHEAAGEILAEMRTITEGFNPPEGSCNSLRYLYNKLNELDQDLQQHIHLENNILFPAALKLEKELRSV